MATGIKYDSDLNLNIGLLKLLYLEGWTIEVKHDGPFIHITMT